MQTEKIDSTAAMAIKTTESGPVPRIIGIGPIRITAPPPISPGVVIDPKIINRIPMKIIAKAMKNSQVANENGAVIRELSEMTEVEAARQLVQDHWVGSKQLPQTAFPQDWQT